jgi:hypothetical protein
MLHNQSKCGPGSQFHTKLHFVSKTNFFWESGTSHFEDTLPLQDQVWYAWQPTRP